MTKTRQLFVSAVVIAALAQLLPMMGVRSMWLSSLLVASNLLVCVLGYRTGNYRTYWLSWGLLTLVAFVMFGLSNPVSMLRLGMAILFAA